MSKSYTLSSSIDYAPIGGVNYWKWDLSITSTQGVPAKPFLVECFFAANQTLSDVAAINKRLIRVVSPLEITRYPTDVDLTTSTTGRWVSYRVSSFSLSYHKYKELQDKETALKASLRSLTQKYSDVKKEPLRASIINISYPKIDVPPEVDMVAYEGDVLAFSPSGGTGDYSLSSNPEHLERITTSSKTKGSTTLLYRVKDIVEDIGEGVSVNVTLMDAGLGTSKSKVVKVIRPTNYGTLEEII